MFWDCSRIALLWSLDQDLLSDLLKTHIQKDPLFFLLLDDSLLSLSVNQKRILFAALTAVKNVTLKLWLDPSTPVRLTWMSYLLDIALLECSTAKIHGATRKTIQFWLGLIDTSSCLLKSLDALVIPIILFCNTVL